MRVVGIILVVLGALALGYYGFRSAMGDGQLWVSPVASGIALVCGLIVLATRGRKEET